MAMTKREKHIKAIVEALAQLDEPVMIPRDRQERRVLVAAAILDAIQDPPPKPKKTGDPANSRTVGIYCELWKARHRAQAYPTIYPQDARNLRALVEAAGEDKAARLLHAYFAMPSGYYMQRRHPVDLLIRDIKAVEAFADSNQIVTNAEAKAIDQTVGIAQQLARIKSGDL
jgi:hypothetical protein